MKRWTARTAVLVNAVLVPTIMLAAAGLYWYVSVDTRPHPVAKTASTTGSPTLSAAPSSQDTTTPASTSSAAPTTATSSTAATPTLTAEEQQELATRVQRAVQAYISTAKVGMEVYDRQTGTVLTSLDPDEQFASMSEVKIFIAVDVLARNNWALPDQATQQKLSRMLSTSDDALASAFWDEDGGGAIVSRDVRLMGLTGTRPPSTPGEWGDTRITAQDMVTVYRYIMDTVPAASRDLLYNAMYNATKIAADGTNQYFGIPDGLPGTTWAIKQGWGTSGSYAVYNTTGLLGTDSRYVVVVLTSASSHYYSTLPKAITAGTSQLAGLLG